MPSRLQTALVAFGLVSLSAGASAAPPRDPSGAWRTEDGRARVRVEKCGPTREQLCGYIVWLKPGGSGAKTDVKNPDSRKSSRPVLGHQLILGLKPNEDAQYEGLIYNADDGKSYDVTVWLERPNDLKVKGCLVAFLCSTQSWTRVTDMEPGQLAGPTGGPGGPQPDPEWATQPVAASPSGPKRDSKPRS